MIYSFAKAVGINSDAEAALVNYFGQGDNLFIALLQLESDDAFARGRQVISDLSDSYFASEEPVGQRLTNLFAESLQNLSNAANFSILLLAISGKVLYLIGKGEVAASLRRIDQVSPLFSAPEQLISGFLQEGDRVVVTTLNLPNILGENLDSLLDLPRDDWEEEMSVKLGSGDRVDVTPLVTAALIMDVEGEEAVTIPKSPVETYGEQPREGLKLTEKILTAFGRLNITLPASGQLRLILALMLILAVSAGVGLKFKNIKDTDRQNQFNELVAQAKGNYNESLGLKNLNPAEAAVKVSSAKEAINKALALKPNDSGALELKSKIAEVQSIGQKYEATFTEYLNLELVKEGFKAKTMSLSVGKLLVLNPDDVTLVVIDSANKSHKILAGKEKLGDSKLVSLNGDLSFSFSKDKGIVRVDIVSEKASPSAKPDKQWGEIVDIYGFGGNIYLLDKIGQIWKYLGFSGGYSDKRKYLTDGVKVDFSNATRMQIESSVYVLKSGGEILRFTRGEPDNFSIGGLDKGIKDPKSFFVSSDTDNLYILDSGNSRLVVLTKTGAYVSQYGGDKFGSSSDLVVDEKGKKVYLLENSKIYVMELK